MSVLSKPAVIAIALAFLALPATAQQPPAPASGDAALALPRLDPQKQYLIENAKKPGWRTTPSGLQYRITKQAVGNAPRPALTDEVTVHYRGVLVDGTVFDSSYTRGRPATFPLSGLIRGWQEAIPMMKVGETWELAVPSELGYGARGQPGSIPGGATLLFTIELLGTRKPDNTNLLLNPSMIR
jgi:FKBP-type peptidyl-prolyl cis-trans isomerase